MTKIALLGAGGKMGVRLSTNLKGTRFDVDHVEISDQGRKRLKAVVGVDCVELEAVSRRPTSCHGGARPTDRQERAHHRLQTAARRPRVIVLDAAAPHAGEMPDRKDVTYFVTHPCHPPIFNDETDETAKNDFFGGIRREAAHRVRIDAGPRVTLCALRGGGAR